MEVSKIKNNYGKYSYFRKKKDSTKRFDGEGSRKVMDLSLKGGTSEKEYHFRIRRIYEQKSDGRSRKVKDFKSTKKIMKEQKSIVFLQNSHFPKGIGFFKNEMRNLYEKKILFWIEHSKKKIIGAHEK